MRASELDGIDQMVAYTQFQGQGDADPVLKRQSASVMREHLGAVEAVLRALREDRTQQLLLIQTSSKYVDRLVAELQQCLSAADRFDALAASKEKQREQTRKAIRAEDAKLRECVAAAVVLRGQVQDSVTVMMGRKVNIVGDFSV